MSVAKLGRHAFVWALLVLGCSVPTPSQPPKHLVVSVYAPYHVIRVGEWASVFVTVNSPHPSEERHFTPVVYGDAEPPEREAIEPRPGEYVVFVRFNAVGRFGVDMSRSRLNVCTSDGRCFSSDNHTFPAVYFVVEP